TKAKLASVINAKLKDGYLLAGEFRVEQIKDKFTYLQPMMKSIIMPPTAPPPSSLKNEDISDAEFVPVDA
ncbi:hypothetical protein HN803_04885, partial [candidate division WWE3 bacterium]|nr:hypothetical protein [candidate division WWE3 bacterium]